MSSVPPPVVGLRGTLASDIPTLFEFQLDPIANHLAGTKPRDLQTFRMNWEKILRGDPDVTARVIVADDVLVGAINIFKQEGVDSIGYWIARTHWGRGIATRAIGLILKEAATRPLFAQVVTHNEASRRALERNGFRVTSWFYSPETERYIAGEVMKLTLS